MTEQMPGMVYDDKSHTYIDKETRRVVPAENADQYAREKLDEALEKLAAAFVRATAGRLRKEPK